MVVKIKRSASLVKHVGVGLRVFMRSDGMYLGTGIEAKINEHKRQNDFVACLNVQTHLNSVKDDLKHTKLHCVAVSTGKNDPWTRYEARHSGKTRPFMTWEQLLDRSQPQTEVMIPICNVSRREEFVLPCNLCMYVTLSTKTHVLHFFMICVPTYEGQFVYPIFVPGVTNPLNQNFRDGFRLAGRFPAGFLKVFSRMPVGFRTVFGWIPDGFRPDSGWPAGSIFCHCYYKQIKKRTNTNDTKHR